MATFPIPAGDGVMVVDTETLCNGPVRAPRPTPHAVHTVPAAEVHAQKARTRTGSNRVYPRLEGSISVSKFLQCIGLRIGKGKDKLARAERILALFGFENVRASTIQTALYDGATPVTRNGPNAQHKPAALSAEQAAALDSAVQCTA